MPKQATYCKPTTVLAAELGISSFTLHKYASMGLSGFTPEGLTAFRKTTPSVNRSRPGRKTKTPAHLLTPSTHAVWYLAELARDLKSFPDWGCLWKKPIFKTCSFCKQDFEASDNRTKTCSRSCATKLHQEKPWISCCSCHAIIGLGVKISARIIGPHASFSAIAGSLRVRGIHRATPPDGSWDLYARRRGLCQKTKAMLVPPWWGDEESAKGWRSNEKASFPDWSYIWTKERATRQAAERYRSMSDDERKAWNKALWEKRKSCPEQLAKTQAKVRLWKKRNPEKHKASVRKSIKARKLRDPGFKIACNMRNRFKEIMEVSRDPSRKWNSSLIGCDTRQLATHLESQFKRGMSWENYGTHWHVDHIIPCAAFDHTKPEQVRQCWHFTNLAPLEAKKNMAKSDKIIHPQLSLLLTA